MNIAFEEMSLLLWHTFPGWLHHPLSTLSYIVFQEVMQASKPKTNIFFWESHSGSDLQLPRKIKGSEVRQIPAAKIIKPFDNISSTETLLNAFSHKH